MPAVQGPSKSAPCMRAIERIGGQVVRRRSRALVGVELFRTQRSSVARALVRDCSTSPARGEREAAARRFGSARKQRRPMVTRHSEAHTRRAIEGECCAGAPSVGAAGACARSRHEGALAPWISARVPGGGRRRSTSR